MSECISHLGVSSYSRLVAQQAMVQYLDESETQVQVGLIQFEKVLRAFVRTLSL